MRGIPFGGQILDIAPGLHRPAERQVYIVEINDRRGYGLLDTVTAPGLPYQPGY